MSDLPKPIAVTKDTVVLARKDWKLVIEALEDAEDRAAVRASLARAAQGKDDGLPIAFYKRLRAGEHPIRVWRGYRKMSLAKVAEDASIARAYLSEIETGKKPGSVDALRRVAQVLGVDIDDLVPTHRSGRSRRGPSGKR